MSPSHTAGNVSPAGSQCGKELDPALVSPFPTLSLWWVIEKTIQSTNVVSNEHLHTLHVTLKEGKLSL